MVREIELPTLRPFLLLSGGLACIVIVLLLALAIPAGRL